MSAAWPFVCSITVYRPELGVADIPNSVILNAYLSIVTAMKGSNVKSPDVKKKLYIATSRYIRSQYKRTVSPQEVEKVVGSSN
jgi:hypothetical protein